MQAQPSPTTGKLPFLMRANAKPTTPSIHKKAQDLSRDDRRFSFEHILRPKTPSSSIVDKVLSLFKVYFDVTYRLFPASIFSTSGFLVLSKKKNHADSNYLFCYELT